MSRILIGTPAKGGHRGINMKELLINHKKYSFRDFLRIPFTVCPVYAGIKTLGQILVSVLPSLQVLATAAFIDTALDIFAGKAGQSAITAPLLCLIAIVAYNNLNWQLMSYINLKMAMGLGQAIAGLPRGMETPLGKIKSASARKAWPIPIFPPCRVHRPVEEALLHHGLYAEGDAVKNGQHHVCHEQEGRCLYYHRQEPSKDLRPSVHGLS